MIINDQGYVFRARNTVSQNGFTDTKNPPASLRGNLEDFQTGTFNEPLGPESVVEHLLQDLQTENLELRLQLQKSQQQHREEMLIVKAKLDALSKQVDKLYAETGIKKDEVHLHATGKACTHTH